MNTHDKALSELVNADVQYDSHSDEWCLRPGCPGFDVPDRFYADAAERPQFQPIAAE